MRGASSARAREKEFCGLNNGDGGKRRSVGVCGALVAVSRGGGAGEVSALIKQTKKFD